MGYLKFRVYISSPSNLSKLKDAIRRDPSSTRWSTKGRKKVVRSHIRRGRSATFNRRSTDGRNPTPITLKKPTVDRPPVDRLLRMATFFIARACSDCSATSRNVTILSRVSFYHASRHRRGIGYFL